MKKYTFLTRHQDGTSELLYVIAADVCEARRQMTRILKPIGSRYELNPREVEEVNTREVSTTEPIEDRTDDFNIRFIPDMSISKVIIAMYLSTMVLTAVTMLRFLFG